MAKSKTEKPLGSLLVHPRRQATFRRTVAIGKTSKQLVFQPGQPVEVTAKEFEGLRKDIGAALVIAKPRTDEKGKEIPGKPWVADWEQTSEVVAERDGIELEGQEETATAPNQDDAGSASQAGGGSSDKPAVAATASE